MRRNFSAVNRFLNFFIQAFIFFSGAGVPLQWATCHQLMCRACDPFSSTKTLPPVPPHYLKYSRHAGPLVPLSVWELCPFIFSKCWAWPAKDIQCSIVLPKRWFNITATLVPAVKANIFGNGYDAWGYKIIRRKTGIGIIINTKIQRVLRYFYNITILL